MIHSSVSHDDRLIIHQFPRIKRCLPQVGAMMARDYAARVAARESRPAVAAPSAGAVAPVALKSSL